MAAADSVCVLIPTYNNQDSLAAVLRSVLKLSVPIIVIDDGSSAATAEILESFPEVESIRHAHNLGKGAALASGFAAAQARGFAIAVTMDADGQHAAADLPALIAAASPKHLVIGVRRMDASAGDVPRSSRFGRSFSNFWVATESGHWLQDTQSGLRVYPLGALVDLQLRQKHYDFEIEVLVALLRRGIIPLEVAVSVYYPPRTLRVSHFHPWRDNFRLSCLHTRLVLQRLRLWPESQHKGSERRGAALVPRLLHLFGKPVCYLGAPWVALYFYLSSSATRTGMRQFYRVLGCRGWLRPQLYGFINVWYFALGLIDRISLLQDETKLKAKLQPISGPYQFPHGAVLVGAHFGDWLHAGMSLGAIGQSLHIVMQTGQTPAYFAQIGDRLQQQLNIIDASKGGLNIALTAKDALESGALVCFLADRAENGGRAHSVNFLGQAAAFTELPFALAHAMRCPLVSFYGVKAGFGPQAPYNLYANELWDGQEAVSVATLVERFRLDLEMRVRATPAHWFNFFPYWSDRRVKHAPPHLHYNT